MPSGSHGGSPGSHSSGGASFGGGSFGGGSHSSSFGGPHGGPHHGGFTMIFFGRSVGGSGSISFAWIFMAIIAFFMSIAFIGTSASINGDISKIKKDYAYYQSMIDSAKKDPENRIFLADVTDYFLGTGGKYYITYKYQSISGYTYSVYSLYEAAALLDNEKVQIAVNKKTIDSTTDSITLDFDGRSYKNDGDYLQAKTSKTIVIVVFSVLYLILGAFVVLTIVGTVKTLKKKDESEKNKTEKPEVKDNKPTSPTCGYCGAALKEGQTQCPSCGARVRK